MTRNTTVAIVGAVAVLLAVGALTGGVGASPSSTSELRHGAENGNYTVGLPFDSDHYPRSKNPGGPYNASINHFAAATPKLFEKKGVPKGLEQVQFIIISNQDIDFSQCSTSNTGAFGVDRDSDSPGTKTDQGLLQYRESSSFNDHSIVVNFYEGDELAASSQPDRGGYGEGDGKGREDGDKNAEVYPDDQIVAHQGYKSGGGPCYAMPREPGWYQINGFINGTGFNGNTAQVTIPSHYFYICECDSEKAAYEQLGAPPGQENPYTDGSSPDDSSTATPTPTATPDSGGGGSGASTPTATPTATSTPTPTATPTPTTTETSGGGGGGGDSGGASGGGGGAAGKTVTVSATAGANAGGGGPGGGAGAGGSSQQADQQGAIPMTPTAGSGPGFGLVAALGGVLAAALLALRRD